MITLAKVALFDQLSPSCAESAPIQAHALSRAR